MICRSSEVEGATRARPASDIASIQWREARSKENEVGVAHRFGVATKLFCDNDKFLPQVFVLSNALHFIARV